MRLLVNLGVFAFLFVWTTFGLVAATATASLWLRRTAPQIRDSIMATVLSAIAAAPSVAFAFELSVDLLHESRTGSSFAWQGTLVTAMRYWILVGAALIGWSFLDVPVTAGKGMVGLVRACHIALWGIPSVLLLLALCISA